MFLYEVLLFSLITAVSPFPDEEWNVTQTTVKDLRNYDGPWFGQNYNSAERMLTNLPLLSLYNIALYILNR